MKKVVSVLFALQIMFCAFCLPSMMYVNSKEGLNVRSAPSMKAEKRGALKYGELVKVAGEGDMVTIDGISAHWTKIILYYGDEGDESSYGWVFGGYLQEKFPMSEDDFIARLKRLSKTGDDFFHNDFFPKDDSINYMQDGKWQESFYAHFTQALPNYACRYFDYETHNEVVAIRDCFIYQEPKAVESCGELRFVAAGEKFSVEKVAGWGIKDGTLFPVYEIGGYAYIRGIDVTGSDCVLKASDGKGGFHKLVYQPVLTGVTEEDLSNYDDRMPPTHENLESYFSHELTYEMKFLRGGFGTNFACYTDPSGKKYEFSIDGRASRFKLQYPLIMKNPVPIIQKSFFYGGMGGGEYSTELFGVQVRESGVNLHKLCEYSYTSADAGFDGMAYHYFDDDGFCVYEFQTDEIGKVIKNERHFYVKNNRRLCEFNSSWASDEPAGESNAGTFKKGKYCNPVCRLKLRTSPNLYGEKINTISGGTLLQVLEVGKEATIDGLKSNWVKVKAVNKERFVEGYEFTQSGWVFGAYLK